MSGLAQQRRSVRVGWAVVLMAAAGCGPPEIAMREACSAVIPAWHLPGAVEGYIDPAAMRALVAAAGVTCNEVCQDGYLDPTTIEALEGAGLVGRMEGSYPRFQHTVWASAGVSYELGEWEADLWSSSLFNEEGRVLTRLEHVARLSVAVDEVPGGLTGEARCWIIEDPESGEWWFWDYFGNSGDWLKKADPWLQVWFEHDPLLSLPAR